MSVFDGFGSFMGRMTPFSLGLIAGLWLTENPWVAYGVGAAAIVFAFIATRQEALLWRRLHDAEERGA